MAELWNAGVERGKAICEVLFQTLDAGWFLAIFFTGELNP